MSRGGILRPVAVFALSGLAVLVLVGIAGALRAAQPGHV